MKKIFIGMSLLFLLLMSFAAAQEDTGSSFWSRLKAVFSPPTQEETVNECANVLAEEYNVEPEEAAVQAAPGLSAAVSQGALTRSGATLKTRLAGQFAGLTPFSSIPEFSSTTAFTEAAEVFFGSGQVISFGTLYPVETVEGQDFLEQAVADGFVQDFSAILVNERFEPIAGVTSDGLIVSFADDLQVGFMVDSAGQFVIGDEADLITGGLIDSESLMESAASGNCPDICTTSCSRGVCITICSAGC